MLGLLEDILKIVRVYQFWSDRLVGKTAEVRLGKISIVMRLSFRTQFVRFFLIIENQSRPNSWHVSNL